MTTANRLRPN